MYLAERDSAEKDEIMCKVRRLIIPGFDEIPIVYKDKKVDCSIDGADDGAEGIKNSCNVKLGRICQLIRGKPDILRSLINSNECCRS